MIERIKELISYLGISTRAFCIQCGIKDNTFTNQLNGKRELSLSTIISILSFREDVSAEWLLRGNGDMIKSGNSISDANLLRMERLIDTITTLQETINEKSKTIQLLEEENRKLKTELTVKKIG